MNSSKRAEFWACTRYALLYNLVTFAIVALALFSSTPWLMGSGIFGFIMGAAVGSFLNQFMYRWPRGIDLDDPPSSCPVCASRIPWRYNLPIVGWLLLKGSCHHCRAPIAYRYPLVEFAGAVLSSALFVGLAYRFT